MGYTEILILGAGPAGFSAAKAASKNSNDVTMAGAEPYLPYWRPRLPEILSTDTEIDNILIQKEDWYKANSVKFLPSKIAKSIDTENRSVLWEDGDQTQYGKLIIACGSLPNRPTIPFAEKIYTLRTFEDAVAIKKECGEKKRAFIAGGGVLGLESAFAIAKTGVLVSVADLSEYPLSRQLDREGGLFLKKLIEQSGITIHPKADYNILKEYIEGACVIAAAGVKPNVGFVKNSGIEINNGILVNEKMQTSGSSIYACGDIAEFLGKSPGLIPIASGQGEVAGTNASGGDATYKEITISPVLKVAGLSVMSIGNIAINEKAKVFRKQTESAYSVAILNESILTGAAFIGDISLGTKFKRAIESKQTLDSIASFEELVQKI